ncbi:polysaccharide deacetylase family protein [uncultured Flavobacterium sp.]|uniref:polysaccharide deacetylase family protein n=1 Tax=uncultured Flavobacterium sp. TaxID=165435 RepID=UPI0030EE1D14|tara:strand:- start:62092 stop:63054 length:963 start_codon:yes stop_codon:yes gene_type:complete
MNGNLIISLDFELHWGAPEKWDLEQKKQYFQNTRLVINEMLQLFEESNLKVTWATVGFLFSSNLNELLSFHPEEKPTYKNEKLNNYSLFENELVGNNEEVDEFHFAKSIVKKILETKGQELASHTFSHYYCDELGQNSSQFNADIEAAQTISLKLFGTELKSLVFPRNQYNSEYLEIIKANGFKVIRVNPDVWFWNKKSRFNFIGRAFDTLLPISKTLTFKTTSIQKKGDLILLPASRFFRPYSSREKYIQKIKINRIKREMLWAAKKGENYHLWWHPHNFGYNTEKNMKQLKDILEYYQLLKIKYNFNSKCMEDFHHEK